MAAAVINLRNHEISFNKDATRWLGIWLDSALNFREHKNVYLHKAKRAEARLRSIVGKQGLAPGLVRKVQIAAVQAVAFYGAELWWRDQKSWCSELQKLINRQGRSITGMMKSAPVGVTLRETGLKPAAVILNNRQRRYTERLLRLPKNNPAHKILPVSLRDGDRGAQPGA